MQYSKVTKNGQTTIPLKYREKYKLNEGSIVAFEDTDEGLLLKPIPDIADSAGALSGYTDLEEVLSDLIRDRKKDFR
ncbi:MAG: AbrB/MazE/SpoVT family DNA-binding domain-containing protein [Candidatus Bathyarchaeia archaeon]